MSDAFEQNMLVYGDRAEALEQRFEEMSFEQVHGVWARGWLPEVPGDALDVGAGSGRDARALATLGFRVLAAEPSARLRERAMARSEGVGVEWIDDHLPELVRVRELGRSFSLVLVSAVWMHVPPARRGQALEHLVGLLAPGGVLVISLRHGGFIDDRVAYPVSVGELEAWSASSEDVEVVAVHGTSDRLGRAGVTWEIVVLRASQDERERRDEELVEPPHDRGAEHRG